VANAGGYPLENRRSTPFDGRFSIPGLGDRLDGCPEPASGQYFAVVPDDSQAGRSRENSFHNP
jgi:hypothetical protein